MGPVEVVEVREAVEVTAADENGLQMLGALLTDCKRSSTDESEHQSNPVEFGTKIRNNGAGAELGAIHSVEVDAADEPDEKMNANVSG